MARNKLTVSTARLRLSKLPNTYDPSCHRDRGLGAPKYWMWDATTIWGRAPSTPIRQNTGFGSSANMALRDPSELTGLAAPHFVVTMRMYRSVA